MAACRAVPRLLKEAQQVRAGRLARGRRAGGVDAPGAPGQEPRAGQALSEHLMHPRLFCYVHARVRR
jgi:hypothetical protein